LQRLERFREGIIRNLFQKSLVRRVQDGVGLLRRREKEGIIIGDASLRREVCGSGDKQSAQGHKEPGKVPKTGQAGLNDRRGLRPLFGKHVSDLVEEEIGNDEFMTSLPEILQETIGGQTKRLGPDEPFQDDRGVEDDPTAQ